MFIYQFRSIFSTFVGTIVPESTREEQLLGEGKGHVDRKERQPL